MENLNEQQESSQAEQNPEKIRNTSGDPVVFVEWLTPAYRQTEKSKAWYAIMGIVLFLFILYDLMTGGWVVSITFLILAGVYYMSESKRAPVVKVTISDHGIRFGAQYFQYDQLKSFWILSLPEEKILYLTTYKGVNRQIAILMPEEVNIAKLREYLQLQATEEQGKKESFSDQLIRNLGL
jgi:hypothetical protein